MAIQETPEQALDYLIMKFKSDIENLNGRKADILESNNQIIADFDTQIAEIESLIETIQLIHPAVQA